MWSWYLEWSRIARAVITDRRLLRDLGFLRSARPDLHGRGDNDDADDELEEVVDTGAPNEPAGRAPGSKAEVGISGSTPFST